MSESYLVVELNHQPVELCKLLKIADLVSGGGEAKVVIGEGYVLLNGEVEFQKRKKVYHEDVVEFNGEVVQLIINETLSEASQQPEETAKPVLPASKNKASKQPKVDSTPEPTQQNAPQEIIPKKRRPISF
ncbi:MAG: RNA-binding S4 domain-containing protein [Alteromonadales bacterium]|nr:RNA-binding S4 domain-containing protein [Alteromonadales bacterium]MCP4991194.1 RNA-binding S4 domain-containing protein [Colwellia sp.]